MKKLAGKYIANLDTPGIRLNEIENTPVYYCFNYFHPTEMYVGQGPIFIHKADKRFFIYGSGSSVTAAKTDFLNKIEIENSTKKVFPEFDIQKTYNITLTRILKK